MGNQDRGKIQRPRSSKGYRGNQNQISSHQGQNMGAMNMHHLSAHHLPSGALAQIQHQNASIHTQQPNTAKILNKSEERALKSQGNSRQVLGKNRQKTAERHGGNTHMASHTSHNFHKDDIARSNKGTALASLNSQMQSQSSTQLPSAQVTGGLSKLTKKQLQQIQQQSMIAGTSPNQQFNSA